MTAGLRAESVREEGYDEGDMAVEGRHDWKASAGYYEVDFDYPEWGVLALILREEAVLGKAHNPYDTGHDLPARIRGL